MVMEIEGQAEPVQLPGDGKDLVAFLSFAVMRGFGAQHALIALADRLHTEHHLRLGPLTTFYDRNVEDIEDEQKIGHTWQPAGPLRDALSALSGALAADETARALARRGGAEGLAAQAEALLAPLAAAGAGGRRVRLVYEL